MRFGTPRFLKFADSAELINAQAELDQIKAREMRFFILDKSTPDMIQDLKDDIDDAKGRLRMARETKRIHENTVEGYYQENADFYRLYKILVSVEQVKLRSNPPNKIIPAAELRHNPAEMTEFEADVEVQKRVANLLEGIRARILQRSSGQMVK